MRVLCPQTNRPRVPRDGGAAAPHLHVALRGDAPAGSRRSSRRNSAFARRGVRRAASAAAPLHHGAAFRRVGAKRHRARGRRRPAGPRREEGGAAPDEDREVREGYPSPPENAGSGVFFRRRQWPHFPKARRCPHFAATWCGRASEPGRRVRLRGDDEGTAARDSRQSGKKPAAAAASVAAAESEGRR